MVAWKTNRIFKRTHGVLRSRSTEVIFQHSWARLEHCLQPGSHVWKGHGTNHKMMDKLCLVPRVLSVAWQQGVHAFGPAPVPKAAPLKGQICQLQPSLQTLLHHLTLHVDCHRHAQENGEEFSSLLQIREGAQRRDNLGMSCWYEIASIIKVGCFSLWSTSYLQSRCARGSTYFSLGKFLVWQW